MLRGYMKSHQKKPVTEGRGAEVEEDSGDGASGESEESEGEAGG